MRCHVCEIYASSSSPMAAKLRGWKGYASAIVSVEKAPTHVSSGHVVLAVGFDPVKSHSVEESRKTFHGNQNANGPEEPAAEHGKDHQASCDNAALVIEGALEGHGVQDLGELSMGKRQGPKTKIGSAEG